MFKAWSQVRALVFDLDGTLLDTRQQIVQAASATMQTFGHAPLPQDYAMPNMHGTADHLIGAVFQERGHPLPDTLAAVGQVFEAHYRPLSEQRAPVYPGARQWLHWAASQGLTLAICTNKKQELAAQGLHAVGLLELFACVTGRDTYGVAKPEALPLLRTLQAVQVPPEQAVFIGDTHADAGCAQAAGVPFWWFSAGFGSAAGLRPYPQAGAFAHYDAVLAQAQAAASACAQAD